MASQTPSSSPPKPGISVQSMTAGPKRFIGAVEDEWQMYSDRALDYSIGAPIGFGASSIVYTAVYHPQASVSSAKPSAPIPCALKVLDLDSLPPRSLQLLQRETTLMSLSKHPNVLRVRGSWMDGHKLYIALRLMSKGSAADVMRYGWPGGMEEDVCRCILAQALKGLNYLHVNGFIHRDIKAANLLVDDDGTVLLGDLGVAADLSEDTSHHNNSPHSSKAHVTTATAALSNAEPSLNHSAHGKRAMAFNPSAPSSGPRIRKRKSFVGTPCWMAPELIQGKQYDSSADIWSFGITALELTQGRPPKSRESPQSVLLRTIQEQPSTLDREGGTYKYSRAFKEIVDSCLAKDPSKRPTAEELLQTPFFKAAKKKSYLVNAILKELPPLTQRQERRVAKSNQSIHTVDSWDFATTITSPTTSIYHSRAMEELGEGEHADTVFEMEEDAVHEGKNHSSRGHSRTLSWTDEPVHQEIQEEVLEVAASSPATSDSHTFETSDSQSPDSLSITPSTTPSSIGESQLAAVKVSPVSIPLSNALKLTAASEKAATLLKPPSSTPISASPDTQQSIWSKLKSNVRRPSSSRGFPDERNVADQPDGAGDKKDRGVSSKLTGAGKSMLSRTSSRTAQAVAFIQGK